MNTKISLASQQNYLLMKFEIWYQRYKDIRGFVHNIYTGWN